MMHQLLRREASYSGLRLPSWPGLRDTYNVQPHIVESNAYGAIARPTHLQYSSYIAEAPLLAIADQMGYVTILNTSRPLPDVMFQGQATNVDAQWMAHECSINQLLWIKGDRQMLTASTDGYLHQWDLMTATNLSSFCGHRRSVKCLCAHPVSDDIIASGGLDGRVMVWDMRVKQTNDNGDVMIQPQVTVVRAHPPRVNYPHTSGGKLHSNSYVTAVHFLKRSLLLASASDANGDVKLWDLRRVDQPLGAVSDGPDEHGMPMPLNVVPLGCVLPGHRDRGVLQICEDPAGVRLAVTRRDNSIHVYDALRVDCEARPAQRIYTREQLSYGCTSTFSPGGEHFAFTTACGSLYIGEAADLQAPAIRIGCKSLNGVVSGACWSSTNPSEFAAASQNGYVAIWNAAGSQDRDAGDYQELPLADVTNIIAPSQVPLGPFEQLPCSLKLVSSCGMMHSTACLPDIGGCMTPGILGRQSLPVADLTWTPYAGPSQGASSDDPHIWELPDHSDDENEDFVEASRSETSGAEDTPRGATRSSQEQSIRSTHNPSPSKLVGSLTRNVLLTPALQPRCAGRDAEAGIALLAAIEPISGPLTAPVDLHRPRAAGTPANQLTEAAQDSARLADLLQERASTEICGDSASSQRSKSSQQTRGSRKAFGGPTLARRDPCAVMLVAASSQPRLHITERATTSLQRQGKHGAKRSRQQPDMLAFFQPASRVQEVCSRKSQCS